MNGPVRHETERSPSLSVTQERQQAFQTHGQRQFDGIRQQNVYRLAQAFLFCPEDYSAFFSYDPGDSQEAPARHP